MANSPDCSSAAHQRAHGAGVAIVGLEQQPLEIRGDLDVHRRRLRRLDAERLVDAARQRAGENVVLVGGDRQAIDRQPHALGVIAGQDVAEIAGGDGEGDAPIGRAERDGAGEVVDDLGEDARPVDRVDARQLHRVAEGEIVEQRFDDRLAVVERALDRDGVDVRPVDRRHLAALHVGNASVGIEDEDVGLRLAAEGLDRRRAGVAGGRAEDGGARAGAAQRAVHQPAEPLHGEILERQRRPMEQFEQEEIVVELDERGGRRVAESRVGVLGEGRELGGGRCRRRRRARRGASPPRA